MGIDKALTDASHLFLTLQKCIKLAGLRWAVADLEEDVGDEELSLEANTEKLIRHLIALHKEGDLPDFIEQWLDEASTEERDADIDDLWYALTAHACSSLVDNKELRKDYFFLLDAILAHGE